MFQTSGAGTSHPPPFSVSKLAPTFPQGPSDLSLEGGWDRQQGLHDLFPAWPRPCGPGSGYFPTLPGRLFPGWGFWDAQAAPAWGFQARPCVVPVPPPLPRPWRVGVARENPSGVGVPSRARLGQLRNGTRLSWILNPEPVTGGKGPGRSTERRVRDGADGDPGGRAPNRQWGGPGSPLTGSRGPAVGRLHARRARLPAARPASDGRGRTPPIGGEPRPRGAGRRAPGGGTTSAARARGGRRPGLGVGARGGAWPGPAHLIPARSGALRGLHRPAARRAPDAGPAKHLHMIIM